jgi:hypothetical protein
MSEMPVGDRIKSEEEMSLDGPDGNPVVGLVVAVRATPANQIQHLMGHKKGLFST